MQAAAAQKTPPIDSFVHIAIKIFSVTPMIKEKTPCVNSLHYLQVIAPPSSA